VIPSEVEYQEGQPQPDAAIFTTVKCWLFFGDSDGVGIAKEVGEDLGQLLGGREHLEVKMVPGNHGFLVPGSEAYFGFLEAEGYRIEEFHDSSLTASGTA